MTTAAIAGQFVRFSSLSDGTLRLVVDVPHERANDVLSVLGFPAGQDVALALLDGDLVRARSSPAGESQPPNKMPGQAGATPATSHDRNVTWESLPRTKRAGILCGDERFLEFLLAKHSQALWGAGSDPAEFVRAHCGVSSRAYLDQDPMAAGRWDTLDVEYQVWSGRAAEDRG